MATRKSPTKGALTLVPNGRLTEHTAHIEVTNAPPVNYVHNSRRVTFDPTRLVIRYQWSWSNGGGWRVLEVKALGRNGNTDVNARFPRPETAPAWVQEAIRMATPLLDVPVLAEAV